MQRREKGSGSIWYNQERKRYIGQFQVGVLPNGRPKLKTISGKTKKEVKDKIEKLKAELITGTYIDTSKITVATLATSINDNKLALNVIGERAYLREKETIKYIANSELGSIPIQKLTQFQVENFLSTLTNYSNSLISKVFSTISRSYKKAISLDIITKNIMDFVTKPKSKKQTKKIMALTKEQQINLVNALKNEKEQSRPTMLLLSLFSGMRMGEICALKTTDINFNFGTISINKTITKNADDKFVLGSTTKTDAGTRIIQMSQTVKDLLLNYNQIGNSNNLLFFDKRKNSFYTVNQLNEYYKRVIVRYDISVNSNGFNQHQLRHTFATRCIEAGMPPKVLQKILGHTDIKVTLNTYCDVFDDFEIKYVEQTENYLIEMGIAK